MDDEAAYMALVTSNAQEELTPLERGRHALRSGMGVRIRAQLRPRQQRSLTRGKRHKCLHMKTSMPLPSKRPRVSSPKSTPLASGYCDLWSTRCWRHSRFGRLNKPTSQSHESKVRRQNYLTGYALIHRNVWRWAK